MISARIDTCSALRISTDDFHEWWSMFVDTICGLWGNSALVAELVRVTGAWKLVSARITWCGRCVINAHWNVDARSLRNSTRYVGQLGSEVNGMSSSPSDNGDSMPPICLNHFIFGTRISQESCHNVPLVWLPAVWGVWDSACLDSFV